ICRWRVVSSGNEAQVISVAKVQHTDLGLANARGIRENGIEDRRQLATRGADDFQYFGGRGLALGRLTEFAGELVKLVPQACRGRVLDRRFAGLGPIRARSFHRPSAPTAMHWLRRRWYQLSRVPRKGASTRASGDVRFGSKADICSAKRHVRFTPESDAKCVHSNVRLEARPASRQVVVNDLTENHRLLMTTRDAGL